MDKSNKEILFKKFEILSCFKKNEHSAVYLANHIYLEKKVFLKVLNTGTIPDSRITERFKREAKILAQLEHPNITKVFDFGMFKEHFYISFEYFESKNLRERLNLKNLSNETKKEIFIQIVKALDFAHKKNIIHRDIKPENILINEANKVKITDFGLAQDSLDNLVTQQYSVVGTPAYMSPEQIQGEKVTFKSDLFSLGITASEIFNGKNPFLGKDSSETINNIISFDEKNNEKIFEGLSEDIKRIIEDLLAANPSDRLTSCSEILRILNINNEDLVTAPSFKSKYLWYISIIVVALSVIIWNLYTIFSPKIPDEKSAFEANKITNNNDITSFQNSKNKIDTLEITPKAKNKEVELNNPRTKNVIESNAQLNSSKIDKNINKEVQFGEFYLKCYPWANVYLDNKFIETTPLAQNISKKTGTYLLTLTHPDFPNYSDSIKITADDLYFIEINLDTLFGYFECQVYPWCELYIDGEKKGVTPLDVPIRLNEGNYKLTLKNPQYKSIESDISIKRNDTLRTKFNMTDLETN